ncbi:MAG: class I SAM-dependent methyltransferase [Candidatus Bathyarchaeota archaeon]|nr:class I SAM-dependent methyltransferase [Candidatus Bathyarchaeota archaeon]
MNLITCKTMKKLSSLLASLIYNKIYRDFYQKKKRLMWGANPSSAVVQFAEFLMAKGVNEAFVLDAGCGEGRHAVYLAKLGFKVYGIDISSVAIEKAKKWITEAGVEYKVTLETGDVTRIKCKDYVFDVVIDINTINFIANKRKYLAEISRVLKPEGYFFLKILSDKNKAHGISKLEVNKLLNPFFKILRIEELEEVWEGIPQYQYKIFAQSLQPS